MKPVGILYEHPVWVRPLFEELERRRIPFVRLNATQHQYNPLEREAPYSLVINRTSSSAYSRENKQGVFYVANYLAHLEQLGTTVINGTAAHGVENSKAKQLGLLRSLGLAFPKSRIVNHINQIVPAARSLRFPVLIKANIGNQGASAVRFEHAAALDRAIELNQISLGADHTALVQECLVPQGGHIVRVETLHGKFQYAVKVFAGGDNFNGCPAELSDLAANPDTGAYLSAASERGIRIENFAPSDKIIDNVQRIVKTARFDAGGVEYLISEEDERAYYFEVNTLSHFVTDAEKVIGFNPQVNFVDYLEKRLYPFYERETLLAI